MATFHVSSECEEPGCFYIYPPSYVNELPIKETRIQIQITTSSLSEHSSERIRQRSFHHGRSTRLLLSLPQPQAWRLGEMFRPAQQTSDASDQGISSPSIHGP